MLGGSIGGLNAVGSPLDNAQLPPSLRGGFHGFWASLFKAKNPKNNTLDAPQGIHRCWLGGRKLPIPSKSSENLPRSSFSGIVDGKPIESMMLIPNPVTKILRNPTKPWFFDDLGKPQNHSKSSLGTPGPPRGLQGAAQNPPGSHFGEILKQKCCK